jgi:hypothetical protein
MKPKIASEQATVNLRVIAVVKGEPRRAYKVLVNFVEAVSLAVTDCKVKDSAKPARVRLQGGDGDGVGAALILSMRGQRWANERWRQME